MNNTDVKLIKDIDFETFKEGDEYFVGYASNRVAIFKARIGSFRKGVAIAHLVSPVREFSDVLINVRCEIVFTPGGGRCISESISRILGGEYLVKGEKDISAPGKDWHWVDHEYIVNETNFRGAVYDYPMLIPYERGKVVRYGNTFYDLESYDVICSGPDTPSFHIDSDLIDGKCDVYDTRFFKQLIIEVNEGKIIKWTDITEHVEGDEYRDDYAKKIKNLSDIYLNCHWPHGPYMSGMHEVRKLLASDNPPLKVTDNVDFSKWFFAANALHQILGHACIEYRPNFGYTSGFNACYIDDKYVLLYRHLYSLEGDYLTTLPYTYTSRYGKYFISSEGVFTLDEKLNIEVFPFSKIANKNQYGRYEIGIIDKGDGSGPKDVAFYKEDLCKSKKGFVPFPDEYTEYFDIELRPLKKRKVQNPPIYKEVIKHYRYKFFDGTGYPFGMFQRDVKPYRDGEYVCIINPALIQSCINELSELCALGSKSVGAISPYKYDGNDKIKIFRGMNSTLWFLNYQPKGILDSTNAITYEHDPNEIVL